MRIKDAAKQTSWGVGPFWLRFPSMQGTLFLVLSNKAEDPMRYPPIAVRALAVICALGIVLVTGCQRSADERPAETAPAAAPMAELPDTTGAAVWAYLQKAAYRDNWTLWPDRGELYKGQEPHGMLLTSYLNDAALQALTSRAGTMPDGAIIIKENYMPDSTLAAVTVMYKVAGYNPDHNDWYFTKHLPDGTLDKAPNGMSLEGRLPGCQACHSAKKDNDYIYTSAIGM